MPDEHDIKHRLQIALEVLDAGSEHRNKLMNTAVTLAPLLLEEFPSAVRDEFSSLWADLNRVAGPDGTLSATIRAMSDYEAADMVDRLTGTLQRASGFVRWPPSKREMP